MKILPRHLISPLLLMCSLILFFVSTNVNRSFVFTSNGAIDDVRLNKQSNHLSSAYPPTILQWKSNIEKAAEIYHLDSNLIAAVMLQESGGHSDAYSSSGAVGLMQVMPHDGIAANFMCGNQPCFANRPSISDLKDPDFNIQYGSQLLQSLIDRHQSLREALKAYGPMDMDYRYADLVLSIYEENDE